MLVQNLVNFLNDNNYDYLFVNSTNEFLVEYNEIEHNARYYLTGFSGSTGEALLNKKGEIIEDLTPKFRRTLDDENYD